MRDEDVIKQLEGHNAEAEPPGDWQAKVWAGIAREEAEARGPSPLRWLSWLLTPLIAGAVAVALWPKPSRQLQVQTIHGDQRTRGDHAQIGDQLQVNVIFGEASTADLRIYRGEALVYRCHRGAPGEGCAFTDDGLTAALTVPALGEYRALVIYGGPLPSAEGLDADVAAASAQGLEIELSDIIEVL